MSGPVQLVPAPLNVTLRPAGDGEKLVVLSFPYDQELVELARAIPHRRFDWDRREWSAPAEDVAALKVAEILARRPELESSDEVRAWLSAVRRRWVGSVSTRRYDGRGWLVLRTLAGPIPKALRKGGRKDGDLLLVPLTIEAAQALRAERSAALDAASERCLQALESGDDALPPARLAWARGIDGEELRLEVLWDPEIGAAFGDLPGAEGTRSVPLDPWLVVELDGFLARHEVQITPMAAEVLTRLMAEHETAAGAVRDSRATAAEPLPEIAERLGGELTPFQWAGVRYALRTRGTFLADEQGLGKTVEALACLEADDAFPAIVICPASMKLTWQREAERWLPHRSVALVAGRVAVPPRGETSPSSTTRSSPRTARHSLAPGRGRWLSMSRTTARTRTPSAPTPCARWPDRSHGMACASPSAAPRCSTTSRS